MQIYKTALLTMPKAGSQWACGILSDPRIAGLNGFFLVEPFENIQKWRSQWKDAADGSFLAPVYNVSSLLWQQVSSEQDRAVVILRDPRDMLISWMYAQCYSHGANSATRLWRRVMLSLPDRSRLALAIMRFHMWAAAYDSWTPSRGGDVRNAYVTRYEHMIADQPGEFTKMARFLGWSADQMEKVVADFSFQRLSGRTPGEENPSSHYRKGVAGDWRNHFDQISGRFFEMLYPGLLVRLGYEASTVWFDGLPEIRETGENAQGKISVGEAVELQTEINILTVKMEEERRVTAENISVLSRAADERKKLCDEMAAEVLDKENEINRLSQAARELQNLCEIQGREIETLSGACRERLELIEELNAQLAMHLNPHPPRKHSA